jgi:hypothetical protein
MGRRHLTPEQKSELRGRRYNLEKTAGHGEQAGDQNDPQTTAQRLGQAYGVGEATIKRDGAFAEAVDTLEAEVKQDHLIRRALRREDVQGTGLNG